MQVVTIDQFNDLASQVAMLQRELAQVKSSQLVLNELSVEQAAKYLVCSVDTIRRMIKTGRVKARKSGKTYQVSIESLEAVKKSKPQLIRL